MAEQLLQDRCDSLIWERLVESDFNGIALDQCGKRVARVVVLIRDALRLRLSMLSCGWNGVAMSCLLVIAG